MTAQTTQSVIVKKIISIIFFLILFYVLPLAGPRFGGSSGWGTRQQGSLEGPSENRRLDTLLRRAISFRQPTHSREHHVRAVSALIGGGSGADAGRDHPVQCGDQHLLRPEPGRGSGVE